MTLKRKLMLFFLCFIASLFIPIMIAYYTEETHTLTDILIGYSNKKIVAKDFSADSETFLIFMLAAQNLEDAPEEVIKAMAIIDRSCLWYRMEVLEKGVGGNKSSPEENKEMNIYSAVAINLSYLSLKELKEKWPDSYGKYYGIFEDAILATSTQVIMANGKLGMIPWQSKSAGYTRNFSLNGVKVSGVWGEDKAATGGINVFYWDENILKEKWEIKRDLLGYVLSVKLGGKSYTGKEFAGWLGIPSTCFYLDLLGDGLRITTLGEGEGMGLSIAGAVNLANSGKNCREILGYYYKELTLKE